MKRGIPLEMDEMMGQKTQEPLFSQWMRRHFYLSDFDEYMLLMKHVKDIKSERIIFRQKQK